MNGHTRTIGGGEVGCLFAQGCARYPQAPTSGGGRHGEGLELGAGHPSSLASRPLPPSAGDPTTRRSTARRAPGTSPPRHPRQPATCSTLLTPTVLHLPAARATRSHRGEVARQPCRGRALELVSAVLLERRRHQVASPSNATLINTHAKRASSWVSLLAGPSMLFQGQILHGSPQRAVHIMARPAPMLAPITGCEVAYR